MAEGKTQQFAGKRTQRVKRIPAMAMPRSMRTTASHHVEATASFLIAASPTLIPPPLAFGQVIQLDAFVGLLNGALVVLEAVFRLHRPQRPPLDTPADRSHQPPAFEHGVFGPLALL